MTSRSLPPGPRAPALIQALEYANQPYAYIRRNSARYGSLWTQRLPGLEPCVFVLDPDHIKQVLALPREACCHEDLAVAIDLGPRSLLFLDGEDHRRERARMLPALYGAHLDDLADAMRRATRRALARWRPGQRIDVHVQMQRLTLEIMIECIFGVAEGPSMRRLASQIVAWVDATSSPNVQLASVVFGARRVRSFLGRQARAAAGWSGAPSRVPWRRLGQLKAALVESLRQEIRAGRRDGVEGRADVLALLLQARDEDGRPADEDHLVDELITLLVGGHETSANTLTWLFEQLLREAALLDRLRAQIDVAPVDARDRVPLVDATLRESMRLFPIAPGIPRPLTRPLELGGYRIPARTILVLCAAMVHRDPRLWDDPDRFRAERFLDASPPANVYLPFGGGKRRCIGMTFAMLEMRIILAELLAGCELELCDERARHGVYRGFSTTPSPAVEVAVRPRATRR